MSDYTKIIIRDLRLVMGIGVYPGEKSAHQPVLVNVEADVRVPEGGWQDSYDTVVCYEKVTQGIRTLAATEHIHLAETLAEEIANICLNTPGITGVMVRVEKTAIVPDAAAVGVEIYRSR